MNWLRSVICVLPFIRYGLGARSLHNWLVSVAYIAALAAPFVVILALVLK